MKTLPDPRTTSINYAEVIENGEAIEYIRVYRNNKARWYKASEIQSENIYYGGTSRKLRFRDKPLAKQRRSISRSLRDNGKLPLEAGYVYLIYHEGLNAHKIGMTINLDQRFYALRRTYGEFDVIHTIFTDDMRNFEAVLHTQFAHRYRSGEWFDLIPADVQHIKALQSIEEAIIKPPFMAL